MKKGDKVRLKEDVRLFNGLEYQKGLEGVIMEMITSELRAAVKFEDHPMILITYTGKLELVKEEKIAPKDTREIIKYSASDLSVGDEVYDCTVRKWRPVTKLDGQDKVFMAGDHKYYYSGQHEFGKFPSVVAIRKRELKPSDIPTKEFVYNDINAYITKLEDGSWKTYTHRYAKADGIKYYTIENARKLIDILNN